MAMCRIGLRVRCLQQQNLGQPIFTNQKLKTGSMLPGTRSSMSTVRQMIAYNTDVQLNSPPARHHEPNFW